MTIAEALLALGVIAIAVAGVSDVAENHYEQRSARIFADDVEAVIEATHAHLRAEPSDNIAGWGADGTLAADHFDKLRPYLEASMERRTIAGTTTLASIGGAGAFSQSPFAQPYTLAKEGGMLVLTTTIMGRDNVLRASELLAGRSLLITPPPTQAHGDTTTYTLAVDVPPSTKHALGRLAQSESLNVRDYDASANTAEVGGMHSPMYYAPERTISPEVFHPCPQETAGGAHTTTYGEHAQCRQGNAQVEGADSTATPPKAADFRRRWAPPFRQTDTCVHGACDPADNPPPPNLCSGDGAIIITEEIDTGCDFETYFDFGAEITTGDRKRCEQCNDALPGGCVSGSTTCCTTPPCTAEPQCTLVGKTDIPASDPECRACTRAGYTNHWYKHADCDASVCPISIDGAIGVNLKESDPCCQPAIRVKTNEDYYTNTSTTPFEFVMNGTNYVSSCGGSVVSVAAQHGCPVLTNIQTEGLQQWGLSPIIQPPLFLTLIPGRPDNADWFNFERWEFRMRLKRSGISATPSVNDYEFVVDKVGSCHDAHDGGSGIDASTYSRLSTCGSSDLEQAFLNPMSIADKSYSPTGSPLCPR